jgi:hypothetical protein
MYDIHDDSEVDTLISVLMDKLFDVKNFNIREFLASENNSIAALGQNYRLSEQAQDTLTKLNRVQEVLRALIYGAESKVVNIGNGVPVGANAVLNVDFKDRKIDVQLMEITGNTGSGVMISMNNIGHNLEAIMNAHLKNSGMSIARDKRASIKRSNALIKQLKDAFNLELFANLFANVPDLDELAIPENASDEELADIAVLLRTQLRNFENLFSKGFNELTDASKASLIKELKEKYNPRLDDSTPIQNDEDKINVTNADLY